MGISKELPYGRILSDEERASFEKIWDDNNGAGDACSMENFAVDVTAYPSSAWNVSAGMVFARSLIAKHNLPATTDVFDEIRDVLYTRLRSLRQSYKNSLKPLKEQQRKASENRSTGRKLKVRSGTSIQPDSS